MKVVIAVGMLHLWRLLRCGLRPEFEEKRTEEVSWRERERERDGCEDPCGRVGLRPSSTVPSSTVATNCMGLFNFKFKQIKIKSN